MLDQVFGTACAQGKIDELGNGRFARSLFERACAVRDVRVAQKGDAASPEDLTTVIAADLLTAYRELNPDSSDAASPAPGTPASPAPGTPASS